MSNTNDSQQITETTSDHNEGRIDSSAFLQDDTDVRFIDLLYNKGRHTHDGNDTRNDTHNDTTRNDTTCNDTNSQRKKRRFEAGEGTNNSHNFLTPQRLSLDTCQSKIRKLLQAAQGSFPVS